MKIRLLAAGASLVAFLAGPASAGDCCSCNCKPVHHHVAKAPAHVIHHWDADADTVIHHDSDEEFAQTAYDYHSSSEVQEVTVTPPVQPWVEAPDNARMGYYYYPAPPAYYYAPAYPMAYDGACGSCGQFGGGVGDYEGNDVFVDGYGMRHFSSHPVAPQGGFVQGGFGPERFAPLHGFNFQGGLSNGY